MSNAKKIIDASKPKPKRVARVPKPKIDMANAPDAIVDGQLVVPIGTRVAIPRVRARQQILSVCVIHKLEEGVLHVWDETLTQWFIFNVTDPVVVKVMPVSGVSARI